jgi:hypothetical protein
MAGDQSHSWETFLATLRQSKLVAEEDLALLCQECQESSPYGQTLTSLLRLLIARKFLTPWQASKLRERKHLGFQLDQYTLLDHLETLSDATRYLARDRQTGELALLRIYHRPIGSPSIFASTRYDFE